MVFVLVAGTVSAAAFLAMFGCTLVLSRRCLETFSWLYPSTLIGGWGVEAPFQAAIAGGTTWAVLTVAAIRVGGWLQRYWRVKS